MISKIDKYRIHIIVWFIYIFYYLLFYSISTNTSINVELVFKVLLSNISYAITFYLSSEIVFPLLLNNIDLRTIKFLMSIFICSFIAFILVFTKLNLLVFASNTILPTLGKIDIREEFPLHFWNTQIYVFYALGYYFSQRVIQQQKEIAQKEIEIANQKAVVAEQKVELIKKEIELAEEREKNAILAKEKAQAEMAFLRAQINPHFLFNTLNLIYSKIITAPKEVAGEIMLEFSKMMQYATSTKMQEETVDLEGEITFVKQYLDMYKARNQQNAHIDYEEEGYFGSDRVVPMVLITIVENAMKHGLVDDPQNPLIIRVSLVDNFFVFMVRNLKNPYPHDISGKGNTGVGIVNIIKRLNAVYKNGGFTLESEDLGDDYVVTFTVDYNLIKLAK